MSLLSLFRHRKEILKTLERFGAYKDGEFVVIDKIDLGFQGLMGAELWQHRDVIRAIQEGDLEKENLIRKRILGLLRAGMPLSMERTMQVVGANTWFAEGITQALSVALGYGTQQQNHYFLIGVNDVTPVEAWTLSTAGTKIRSTFGEFTSYAEAVRQTWTYAAAAAKSITNSASPAKITCNGTGTLRGACLVSKSTKDGSSDNTGYAIAGKRFSVDLPAAASNEVYITHTLSGSVS